MRKCIFIGLMGLAIAACQSNPGGYKIKGIVTGGGNGIAILSQPKGFDETVDGDTVKMKNGEFTFEGKLENPGFVSVQICPEGEKPASIGFIAENALIQARADWANVVDQYGYRSIREVAIEGSKNQEVYDKLGSVYQDLLQAPENKEYAEVRKKLDQLHATDVDAYYKLQNETEELADRFSAAVRARQFQLIRENKNVEVAAYYLRFLSNDMSLEELVQEFNGLASEVQNSPMAQEVREEIADRQRVRPGQPAPDFDLATPDGSRLALSDLRGKYVVLDFWASWCRPCRASFPEMKQIYAKYKDKGVEILGITNDSRQEDWLKALEQDQLPWKQVIDEFPVRHKPAKVATLYAIPYLPTLILIDPQGVIVGQAKDKHQLVEWLEERLQG